MTFLPVVGRELCAESRRPFNYWLRVLGAGALTVVAALTLLVPQATTHTSMFVATGLVVSNSQPGGLLTSGQNPYGLIGATLFGYLNATIFAAMWVLVPLLTADSINREKREGTLGLLFLTPLTSSGIVIGKSVVHGLRALTLYCTMIPVLVMPLMLGGVTMKDGLMAALLDLGALLLALAAGLLASAWTRDWLRSVAVAQLLSLLSALVFMAAQRSFLESVLVGATPVTAIGGSTLRYAGGSAAWGGRSPLNWQDEWGSGPLSSVRSLFALNTNLAWNEPNFIYTATGPVFVSSSTVWSELWTSYAPAVHQAWFRRSGLLVLSCLVVLALAVVAAGKSVEHAWREIPPSPQRQKVNDIFTQPVLSRGVMGRNRRRGLDRNPVGWLQQYSLSARLIKWGWCSFVVIGEFVFASNWRDAWGAQFWIALLVLLGLSFSSAGSFHRERETGALELLLVTPLSAGQIIRGRLGGIGMQYVPSFATLLLAWGCLVQENWLSSLFQPASWERSFATIACLLLGFVSSFVTLPIIGLCLSLRPMHQLVSWLWTCLVGLIIPWLLFQSGELTLRIWLCFGAGIGFLHSVIGSPLRSLVSAFAWQLAAALVACLLLYRNLSRRHFITTRT